MDYRNVVRVLVFNRALHQFNRRSDYEMTFSLAAVMYSIVALTRNLDAVPSPAITKHLVYIRATKQSHYYTMKLLHKLKAYGLADYEQLDKAFYWKLTMFGVNELKRLERHIRISRADI